MKTPKKAVTTMMALMMGCLIGAASAKLPAPPPVDPAVAEAAKKKAADAAKMQADQLAKAQDRVAERYKKQIRFVAEKLGNKDVRALERFATAIYVTLDLDTPPDQRAAKINELKPHVSIPEAEQAVREADEFLKEAAAAKV